MERSTIFKNGKPSISMGHGFHGYVKSPEGTWQPKFFLVNIHMIVAVIPLLVA